MSVMCMMSDECFSTQQQGVVFCLCRLSAKTDNLDTGTVRCGTVHSCTSRTIALHSESSDTAGSVSILRTGTVLYQYVTCHDICRADGGKEESVRVCFPSNKKIFRGLFWTLLPIIGTSFTTAISNQQSGHYKSRQADLVKREQTRQTTDCKKE